MPISEPRTTCLSMADVCPGDPFHQDAIRAIIVERERILRRGLEAEDVAILVGDLREGRVAGPHPGCWSSHANSIERASEKVT